MSSMIVLFSLAVLISIVWCISDGIRNADRNRQLAKFSQFPVRRLPMIGHLWYFFGSPSRALRIISEACVNLESPFVIWIGYVPTVHLSKVEHIEEVSKACCNRNVYGIPNQTFGDGIFVQDYEKWKRTRRLVSPTFNLVMLNQYLHVFHEQSGLLANLLQKNAARGEFFDLWPFLLNANVDIITENMMGIQSNCQRDQGNEYSEAFIKALRETLKRVIIPLLYPNFMFKIYSHITGLIQHVDKLNEYSRKAINKALKNYVDITGCEERISPSGAQNIPNHMVDILLVHHMKDPRNMTKTQLRSELIHMIGAGSETTAIGVGFLMLMYGMHQDEQNMVYQEIMSIVPYDRPITMEDLNQFKYLEKTIKETLRLFSLAPLTLRTLQHDITLPSEYTIPSNLPIFIHLQAIHRNPAYYPNPKKWNPENFSEEAVAARPPNSFAPFGLGSRACIGSKYAMLSIKVQTIHLLRKYRIFTDVKLDEIILEQDILYRSRDGYRVKLQIRES